MNKPLSRIPEKLKRFFTDIRLREKMLLFYLIGGVLPLVMADIYMYSSVRSVMLEQEKQAAEDELSIIADSVSECIAVIEDISKRLYFNESIEHIAFTTYKSYEEILADYRDCDTITDFMRHYYQEISGITIYTCNPTISNNEYFIYADENLREQADYVETVSRAGAPYWSYEFDRMTGKYNLRLSRVLYTADMERVGIVSIEMQNKRSELPVTERTDEIAELHNDLTSMIHDIQELMAKVVQEQVQKEQLNTRQKEVEFKMLASQINPHFLYNTLETIRMQARVNHQPEIEELTKMLAKIMRRNIQVTDSLQTLKSELQLVEYYLKIQDYRFHDRIQ